MVYFLQPCYKQRLKKNIAIDG